MNFTPAAAVRGRLYPLDTSAAYVQHLLSYVDVASLKPLKIVVDAGNGGAGRVVDLLEPHLPFEFIKLHHEADGNFPNGVPNPLLPENRAATIAAVREHGADLGLAWDGDFDRCFFFDEHGDFIEGYYVVGLLAEAFLKQQGPARIVHDPRLTWNTIDIVGHSVARRTEQNRACLYQGANAAGKCRVRRRDERAPLFSGLRLLRQRHDSVAAGDRFGLSQRCSHFPTGG